MTNDFKLQPPEKPYYLMEVKEGKTYYWCSCSKSENQPFCDGSHKGSDFAPVAYEATETKDVFFCGCKKTTSGAMCNGNHKAC